MGVEYRHFLVVADPALLPKTDTISRIDGVLREWSLVADEPEIYDLSGGGKRRVIQPICALTSGAGCALIYPMVRGPKVSGIVGPSRFPEVEDEDRYCQRIALVVGSDYRIHWSTEGTCFTVVQPPTNAGMPVEPYSGEQHLYLYGEAYPTKPKTAPPTVKIEVNRKERHHIGWKKYSGFWRCALVLDCGKDLPQFTERKYVLPCKKFVQAISDGFRSPVHEVGEIY